MAIQLPQGFKIGSIESIDSRIVMTKAQMKSANENVMPANYFCVCKDDGRVYVYNKTNVIDPEIGKFKSLSDANELATKTEVNSKQDALVSGTNIKSVNGNSLLGSGDLDVESKPITDKEIQDICK